MSFAVAPNVQNSGWTGLLTRSSEPSSSMNREFQTRFTVGLLVILTLGSVWLGIVNFKVERQFPVPYQLRGH